MLCNGNLKNNATESEALFSASWQTLIYTTAWENAPKPPSRMSQKQSTYLLGVYSSQLSNEVGNRRDLKTFAPVATMVTQYYHYGTTLGRAC